MFQANYPVIGIQECYPVYLTGIGISDPEFHTHREEGLISHQILFTMSGKGKIIVGDKEYTAGKGSIFYVASGEPHTYYPIDGDILGGFSWRFFGCYDGTLRVWTLCCKNDQ